MSQSILIRSTQHVIIGKLSIPIITVSKWHLADLTLGDKLAMWEEWPLNNFFLNVFFYIVPYNYDISEWSWLITMNI